MSALVVSAGRRADGVRAQQSNDLQRNERDQKQQQTLRARASARNPTHGILSRGGSSRGGACFSPHVASRQVQSGLACRRPTRLLRLRRRSPRRQIGCRRQRRRGRARGLRLLGGPTRCRGRVRVLRRPEKQSTCHRARRVGTPPTSTAAGAAFRDPFHAFHARCDEAAAAVAAARPARPLAPLGRTLAPRRRCLLAAGRVRRRRSSASTTTTTTKPRQRLHRRQHRRQRRQRRTRAGDGWGEAAPRV